MRIISSFSLLAGLVVWAGSVVGQEGKVTPPRLRIATKQENQDKGAVGPILKVDAVTPGGLGQQLGLKPGDIFESIQIDGQEPIRIKTPQDLSRCLVNIGKATFRPEKAARIALRIRRDVPAKGMKEQTINGTIFRADFLDKVDGGTLYYFRPKKPD